VIYHSIPRIILFCILNAIVSQQIFAQPNKAIDSLLNVLKMAKEDTNKVYTLIALGMNYAAENPNEGLKCNNAALQLATSLNFRRGMAASYFRIGNINYWRFGNFSEALKNHQESLKIWEELGNKPEIAGLNHNIGLAYLSLSKYAEALKYLTIARKMYDENGQKGHVADVYNTTGGVYKTLGNYPEALKNYFAAIEIGDGGWGAAAYNNIGVVYRQLGNYSEALKYHLVSLKIREEEKNKEGSAYVYLYIGNVYSDLGNYHEALKNHFTAFKLFEEAKSRPARLANAYADIAAVYARQENFPEALKNYQASLEKYDSKSKPGMIDCYIGMGKIYIRLKNVPEAKEYLTRALSLSIEIGSKERIRNAYDGLCKLDSAIGNYQQWLTDYKLYTHYKDSILNETSSIQIVELKEQYESEKKDKQILQLSNEKQKLETEKQLTALLIKSKGDSLNLVQSEGEKLRLENEKQEAINLYNQQEIALLANEKRLQQLQIEKNKADLIVQQALTEKKESDLVAQKAETDKKQEQLIVMGKEKLIQDLQLKKQRQAKNYFIASLALVLILAFLLYHNYHNRQKLKLLTLRNKIASDLHDDVGSTLSSISIFSQMALDESKEVKPMLQTISESSRKMLDAMADIVWTINPENDQFDKIISRMKSFAYELLGAKNIDFEFLADDEVAKINLPMEVRKNLYLIFKEATNNMVKYAQANKAMFAIKGEKNNLTMMIKDNGKGFDVMRETGGNGLKNMRKRASEMGADLLIDSHPGNGTLIQLKVAV
jgi:signal transduction histidine kinase